MNYEKENLSLWQRLVSSSTGAIVTSILVTPLDVVKIRIQVYNTLYDLQFILYIFRPRVNHFLMVIATFIVMVSWIIYANI